MRAFSLAKLDVLAFAEIEMESTPAAAFLATFLAAFFAVVLFAILAGTHLFRRSSARVLSQVGD